MHDVYPSIMLEFPAYLVQYGKLLLPRCIYLILTSYLVDVVKRGESQPPHLNVPASFKSLNGDVHGGSVPSLRRTLYRSGRRISFHSSSDFSTFTADSGTEFVILRIDIDWNARQFEKVARTRATLGR